MKKSSFYSSYNAAYIQELYERYLRDPDSVDPEWRGVLAALSPREAGLVPVSPAEAEARAEALPAVGPEILRAAVASAELVDAYRLHGHRAARLDPLGSTPPGHPMLDPAFHGIDEERLRDLPASILGLERVGPTMLDVLGWLRETYTATIGYEFEHIEDPERREWLRERIETGEDRAPLGAGHKERLLKRLTEVEALEQFLHRAYLGKKRFSAEGTDMMVPMLDLAIERAAAAGAHEVVLGMSHRGRLNVLAHVLGRPYTMIIAEFEGGEITSGTTGDVKYHLGAEGTYATVSGEPLTVTLAPNPSHLEAVDPVVEGMARAKQNRRDGTVLDRDENAVLPVLIHGDAAFAGQGIVTETLNLSELDGYRTGGTLHLIANNQIGFTTAPGEGRSTYYASDVARGLNLPIFHVNADDPVACLAVVRLALAYRARFHDDVVIDLIGYRRFGHNEGDEPAYTQPRMYAAIDEHPSVRTQWADRLVERGVLTRERVEALWDETYQRLIDAQNEVTREAEQTPAERVPAPEPASLEPPVDTTVPADLLRSIDRQLHAWPDGLALNPKLERQLGRRAK
ncbi:MAG: thiamine pyrophosphate-dependent enzyme, partial [Gemmatimonadota bacterium]